MNPNEKLTLGYWAIRGLGQPLRFFLNYVGVEFEDKRYSDREEWFDKDKPAFASKLANLPYLKIGDSAVFETDAIFYAIAALVKRQELVGKDLPTQVKVALARSIVLQIKQLFVGLVYDKDNFETKKEKELENIGLKFAIMDEILEKSKWVAGEDLTYVDFMLFEFVDQMKYLDLPTFEKFSNIVSFHTRFMEVPQNKTYIESRDYIQRPFNSPAWAAFF